ncbi:Cytokinin oxidase [Dorcoceras hygrometricum]|uniref:Cytokinin oxidase n=1 Tax=Dorcoceras hygrometricum TaxID=472368 RepID=A0A2Z7CTE6_9LAMI|nr:Cytokinin oxidase [Dorcoceras hygrometricum]
MASSFISNALQINFDSVLGIQDNEGMGNPAVTLGETKTFPPLKILSAKTVNTYVATNKKIDARGDADEPAVAKVAIIKKKVVSKKQPAVASEAPAVKKKRTKSRKTSQKEEALALTTVAQEVVPLQSIAPSSVVPAETESAMENVVEEQRVETAVDIVDEIIAQIISETTNLETYERESDMVAIEADRMIETGSDSGDEMEDVEPLRSGKADDLSGATQSEKKADDSATADYFVTEPLEATEKSPSTEIADIAPTIDWKTYDEESMSIDDLLDTIPHDSKLPSSAGVKTKIQFGKSIKIKVIEEGDWYKTRLPKIPAADKGKAPLSEKDSIKGHPARKIFSLICADIELLVNLREQVLDKVDKLFNSFSFRRLAVLKLADIYAKEEQVLTWAQTDSTKIALQRRMYLLTKYRELLLRKFLEARRSNFVAGYSLSAVDLIVLDMLSISSRCFGGIEDADAQLKVVRAQNLADTRKVVQELKAVFSNDILDFRAQAQENYNNLTTQLFELVDYINRGGIDKKGENSNRGPHPPPDDRDRSGSGGFDGRNRGGRSESSMKRYFSSGGGP